MKTRAVLLFAVGVLAVASSFQGADATQLTSESIQDGAPWANAGDGAGRTWVRARAR